jgi:CRISPR/Cas system-associated exonuclease Cas4 (RecB family)
MALATLTTCSEFLYNPAQEEVLDLLGSRADERPEFPAGLRAELRADLEDGLRPLLDALPPGETLRLSKYPLAQVHGCEARFLATRAEPFAWTVPSARGTIAHKAVELSVHWRSEPRPLELVDEAMTRLSQGQGSLALFLATCTDAELAELRGEANDRVAKFLECFPPLKSAWRPVTESAVRVELFEQRVILQGRVDLTLGQARGVTAGKVLIDLKTGGFSPGHADDLRFYALLETLRIGTPPIRVATYYLDSGSAHPEAVTADVLRTAVRRLVDGATRLVELCHHDHPPRHRPGPPCGWCPLRATCTERAPGPDDGGIPHDQA